MGYLDQALTAQINAKVDELNSRISKSQVIEQGSTGAPRSRAC